MSTEISARQRMQANWHAAQPASRQQVWARGVGAIVLGSLFVAVCAHIVLPLYFTPVPLSMAPFAVLVLGLLLRPRLAATTLCAYLVEGAMGLPVFAPSLSAPTGIAHLLGPTGGYLLSYPLAAAVIALLMRRVHLGSVFARAGVSATLGSFVILASGALWLAALTHASLASVAKLAVIPFLPGDALKIVLAAAICAGWQRVKHKQI